MILGLGGDFWVCVVGCLSGWFWILGWWGELLLLLDLGLLLGFLCQGFVCCCGADSNCCGFVGVGWLACWGGFSEFSGVGLGVRVGFCCFVVFGVWIGLDGFGDFLWVGII